MSDKAPASAEIARICDEVRDRGFSILEDVLDLDEVSDLNSELDRLYALQCAEVGGENALASIGDADVVRCPLAYDDRFLALACSAPIRKVASQLLGESIVLLFQNGVINRPEESTQNQYVWHRDLSYQYWTSSKPLAVSALVCLENFNATTGGTMFLPSSHKIEQLPSEQTIAERAAQAVAPAGSVIFFDAMLFHRAGLNRSNKTRRAINHVIGVPILCQQFSIPEMLDRPAPHDPYLAAYLGYRWSAANSIAEWRKSRIKQSAPATSGRTESDR